MKILFTAFKGKNNVSFRLVSQLKGPSLLLTNSFSGLEREILSLTEVYDAVFMFGIDPELDRCLRIETQAAYQGRTLSTAFDTQALSENLCDANIPHSISDTPIQSLCNAAYYHMLQRNPGCVFIHIPSQKGTDPEFMEQLVSFFNRNAH